MDALALAIVVVRVTFHRNEGLGTVGVVALYRERLWNGITHEIAQGAPRLMFS